MTTLNTIDDINNEIIRITNTIHEKNIDYNFELQSLTNSNNTLMSYIAEYEKIKTRINSIQYSIDTNSQGVMNNMSMFSILKNLTTCDRMLTKSGVDLTTYIFANWAWHSGRALWLSRLTVCSTSPPGGNQVDGLPPASS